MHFSTVTLATVVAVGANAHGGGVPQILGLNVADLKARSILHEIGARLAESQHTHTVDLKVRQGEPASPRECGEGIGSCPAGKCCSQSGFCGTTDAYCYSPNCQWRYGPGCPEHQAPAGSNTSSISREKLGSIAYGGEGIFRCTTPGTIAITYDDGPQTKFTDHILDLLKSYNAKATFFVTGNNINKGQIDIKHADALKRIDSEGHQVGSHTYTHLDLSKITSLERKNQMWMNEMAIRNVLGKIPTYMRPPYSSCTKDSGCQQDIADLGYHITNFNVDTDDYNRNKPEQIQNSKDWFKGNITKDGADAKKGDKWLAIGHDILDQTANNLTEYMLQTITQLGYKAVTVGDCLGDSKDNWYRKADGAGVSTNNRTTSTNGSTSGSPTGGDNAGTSGTTSGTPAANSPVQAGSASAIHSGLASVVAVALFSAFAFL